MVPFEVAAQGSTTTESGWVTLPEKSNQPTEIRTRKQVDGLRMYVDEENPLFMIRNCPIWGGPQTGEAFAEYAIKTYNALPEDIRNRYCLMGIENALKNIHSPESEDLLSEARRRLIFEELLILRLGMWKLKGGRRGVTQIQIPRDFTPEFWQSLPFTPTNAQRRVVEEALEEVLLVDSQVAVLAEAVEDPGKEIKKLLVS